MLKSIVAIGSMSITFGIGHLAKQTGVKVVTIRYYEQAGLLPMSERTPGNYRVYAQEHLQRLNFIRRCRELGFSLQQIRDLLLLSASQSPTCADVCSVAADHLREVESKISDLKRLASELRRIGSACDGTQPSAECRLIASLTNA
jgi:Cu(I)-responsive transcriptional regulator